jgi:hypothetical protein
MSVYSAIYHCPRCPPGKTLLETPSYACAQDTVCPVCQGVFLAPWFDLLHERAGDHCEGEILRFPCPACGQRLQTDTLRNGRPTSGQPVACLFCSVVIEVPAIGDSH